MFYRISMRSGLVCALLTSVIAAHSPSVNSETRYTYPTQYPAMPTPYTASGAVQSVPARAQFPAQSGIATPGYGVDPRTQSMPAMSAGEEVILVQASRLGSTVTLGGTVVPYKEVTLTAQIPGRIEFIAGAEGDHFAAQEVLLSIDDDDLLAKRRAAVAALSNSQSEINNAQVQYSRELWSPQSRSIYNSPGMGLPSMFDQMFTRPFGGFMGNSVGNQYVDRHASLSNFGTRVNQAKGRMLSSQSQLEEVDAMIRDSRSVAPFDGVVIAKLVEQGDTVQPGQALLIFADTKYLQIQLEVPARLMPGLSKGMFVPARLDVGDTRVQARVAQIYPAADRARHTVTVKLDLPVGVPGGPGMYAETMIHDVNVRADTFPVIPESAVMWRGSLPAVFVVSDNGHNRLRLIRLGDYVNGHYVAVLSGLKVGERIRANPPPGMASGWAPAKRTSAQ